MTVEIRNENVLVSVEVQEGVEGRTLGTSVLIAAMEAIEHACPETSLVESYCRVDPDVLDVREEDDPILQAYRSHGLCYARHLRVSEEENQRGVQ